jgi:nucleotidyltransferase/DNA polymerase involved in DNA repair/DNA-directed RNA polymerase specialized sigma24 family protein
VDAGRPDGRDADFSELVHSRWPRLVRLAYGFTGDIGLAEDLAQTALANAYASWSRLQRADDPDRYLIRILINAHRSGFRKGRPAESLAGPMAAEQTRQPAADPTSAVDDRGVIVTADDRADDPVRPAHLAPARTRRRPVVRQLRGGRPAGGHPVGGLRPAPSPARHRVRLTPRSWQAERVDAARRWILHVDLDQFIAAVEILRRPDLRGLPVVVGGDGDPAKRGVVATASYEARERGVHSGLPMRTAARRCPDAVFLPADKPAYEAASADVMDVLRDLSPVTEVMGWDEAFLAVPTDDPEAFARRIQDRVRDATQLECSVGIGENRLQAKLATGFGKPAGVFRLTGQNWFEVLGDEPASALWGIGAKTARKLAELGVLTVRQLAEADIPALAARFGPVNGPWLVLTARGIGSDEVSADPYVPRSRSREVTFQQDLADWAQVREAVAGIAGQVTADVLAEQRPAVRIIVKVRYKPFFTSTHGVPLPEPSSDRAVIEQAALAALEKFTNRRPVRLLGVRAEFAPGDAR